MFIKIRNLIFTFFLLSRTVIIMSSSRWLMSWICLEINLIALIPLLIYKIKFKNSSTSIKYFTVQAIASILIFIGIVWANSELHTILLTEKIDLITISLAIKLGIPPFQFWVPQVIEIINIVKILMVLVWQKIAPIVLICYSISNVLLFIVVIRSLLGAVGGINQNNLKKIFFYSSLVHLSWIIIILSLREKVWLIYLFSYSLIIFPLLLWCYQNKIKKMNNVNIRNLDTQQKIFLLIRVLCLAGLPPFLGFLIKIIVIQFILLERSIIFMRIFLVIGSLVSIFYYFKITWTIIIITNSKSKLLFNNPYKKTLIFFIMLTINIGTPIMVFLI